MKISSVMATALLLLLVFAVATAQEVDAPAPAPSMENGAVAGIPGIWGLLLAFVVSFFALFFAR